MILRLILVLAIAFIALKLYKQIFGQKKCIACHQRIPKQAAVCHHCQTLQSQ